MNGLRKLSRSTIYSISLCTMVASAAQAALPPKYQRLREFEAILAEATVTSVFPDSEVIVKIEFVQADQYRVSSANCRMAVVLEDAQDAIQRPGPRRFVVKAGALVCPKRVRR